MRSRRKSRDFYRFIISNHSSLMIPTKFTRDHRKHILVNNLHIIVPADKFWRVWPLGWSVSGDGKLWIQDGWPEFAKYYGLNIGHMLLFSYSSISVFHVRIFGPSSCEMDYLKSNKSGKQMSQIDRFFIMAETEVFHKPIKFQEMEVDTDLSSEQRTRNRWSKSANPYYMVTIRSAYLGSSGVYVPIGFSRRYLTSEDNSVNCILQTSDGRHVGEVKCKEYGAYAKINGKNWKKFGENHLNVGDVCVFELVNEIANVLKVTIFPAC